MDRKRKWHDDEPRREIKSSRTDSRTEAASGSRMVAHHYNQRPNVGVEKRKESRIIRLRSFNNWVKSVLINQHVRRGQTVLDMGCGKGGDLNKWAKANIAYLVAADIANVSLEHMEDRYRNMRHRTFDAEFHALDCYQELLAPRLKKPSLKFDVVSMQFCLHYAFENETKARTMFENVSRNLRPGGWFLGTIPDANWVVKRVREEPRGSFGFGNSVYSIHFESIRDTDDARKKAGFSRYGCKYMFHLVDAVDCPEYLVHWPTFERLAKEYGLELRLQENFHDFYETQSRDERASRLLDRIGVVGGHEPDMCKEQWEAAGIYLAFAFQKR